MTKLLIELSTELLRTQMLKRITWSIALMLVSMGSIYCEESKQKTTDTPDIDYESLKKIVHYFNHDMHKAKILFSQTNFEPLQKSGEMSESGKSKGRLWKLGSSIKIEYTKPVYLLSIISKGKTMLYQPYSSEYATFKNTEHSIRSLLNKPDVKGVLKSIKYHSITNNDKNIKLRFSTQHKANRNIAKKDIIITFNKKKDGKLFIAHVNISIYGKRRARNEIKKVIDIKIDKIDTSSTMTFKTFDTSGYRQRS